MPPEHPQPSSALSQPPGDTGAAPNDRRRLGRATPSLLAAVSLLLFLAAAAGWGRSLLRTDIAFLSTAAEQGWLVAQSDGEILVGTCFRDSDGRSNSRAGQQNGSFHVSHVAVARKEMDLGAVVWLFMIGDRQTTGAGSAGFGYFTQTDAHDGPSGRGFFCPHWAILLVTSVYPAGWLIRRWRRRRFRRSLTSIDSRS